MPELLILTSLALLGLIVGVTSALVGAGGGFINVPILILLYGLEPRQAVGTSLTVGVFLTFSAMIAYLRQRRIDLKLGFTTSMITMPASSMGAYLTTYFSPESLQLIIGIVLLLLALRILFMPILRMFKPVREKHSHLHSHIRWSSSLWKRRIEDSFGNSFDYYVDLKIWSVVSFAAGLSSGFISIGGGPLMTYVYSSIMNIPIHVAVATTIFSMIFSSISGSSTHIYLGNVTVNYAISLIIGAVVGSQLGAKMARRLKREILQFILGLVLTFIAILLMLSS